LIIAKQRNGPVGTIELHFNSRFTRFDNLHHGRTLPRLLLGSPVEDLGASPFYLKPHSFCGQPPGLFSGDSLPSFEPQP